MPDPLQGGGGYEQILVAEWERDIRGRILTNHALYSWASFFRSSTRRRVIYHWTTRINTHSQWFALCAEKEFSSINYCYLDWSYDTDLPRCRSVAFKKKVINTTAVMWRPVFTIIAHPLAPCAHTSPSDVFLRANIPVYNGRTWTILLSFTGPMAKFHAILD